MSRNLTPGSFSEDAQKTDIAIPWVNKTHTLQFPYNAQAESWELPVFGRVVQV
jgi:hypothetical protein